MSRIGKELQQHIISRSSLLLAAIMFVTPLQKFITLSRVQHYGICLFVAGIGHVLELVWSWRSLKRWGRLGLLATGTYMAAVGITFYSNPNLDLREGMATVAQSETTRITGWRFSLAAIFVLIIWTMWMKEEASVREKAPRHSDDKQP